MKSLLGVFPGSAVGVSNMLGWVKRLRVKRVTGEKHVNPNTIRLLNVLNGLTHLSPESV